MPFRFQEGSSLMKEFQFEQAVISRETGEMNFYFSGPKELVTDKFPQASASKLNIYLPYEHCDPEEAEVMLTAIVGEEKDLGWSSYGLDHASLQELIGRGLGYTASGNADLTD